jgi:protein-tyrosine phosphatase
MPEAQSAPPRVIALDGGHNFREVGGLPTNTGATMRRGLIWRSAGLDLLTPLDCDRIHELGIRTIADLRTGHERDLFPTPTALSGGVRMLNWNSNAEDVSPSTDRGPAWRDLEPASLRGEIARLYTHIADAHAFQFGDIYRSIAEGGAPILIHCTAGKDRTGLAVALLLELIGVTREWILWDYDLTNTYLKKNMVRLESAIGVGGMAEWLAALGPEGRDLLLNADVEYLKAALAGIEERFGSVEHFALGPLGLSGRDLQALRDRLLEA